MCVGAKGPSRSEKRVSMSRMYCVWEMLRWLEPPVFEVGGLSTSDLKAKVAFMATRKALASFKLQVASKKSSTAAARREKSDCRGESKNKDRAWTASSRCV